MRSVLKRPLTPASLASRLRRKALSPHARRGEEAASPSPDHTAILDSITRRWRTRRVVSVSPLESMVKLRFSGIDRTFAVVDGIENKQFS